MLRIYIPFTIPSLSITILFKIVIVNKIFKTANVINGALEYGPNNPDDYRVVDRIGYYKRYTGIFNVSIENGWNCRKMQPYVKWFYLFRTPFRVSSAAAIFPTILPDPGHRPLQAPGPGLQGFFSARVVPCVHVFSAGVHACTRVDCSHSRL